MCEKGKKLQDLLEANEVTEDFLKSEVYSQFHYQTGFKKLIQTMISEGKLKGVENNWNDKQVRKIENYIVKRIRLIKDEKMLKTTYKSAFLIKISSMVFKRF